MRGPDISSIDSGKAPGVRLSGGASIGAKRLFAPISLWLAPGEWTCLLGASGVGKSTILRLIAGLETEARFQGEITAEDGAPLAGRVAYMAQSDLLFPWLSLLENVALGARLRGERPDLARAQALIDLVGLSGHEKKRPSALSGGERQRAALARTLMEDRPVILLDEPFTALDARTRAEVQEAAADLLAGRTVLLVTHDPGEAARMGRRILVMTPEGMEEAAAPSSAPIRPIDDPETLARQGDLYRRLLGRG